MAKQDLGKIVPTFNGTYNANIIYEKLCIVNYNGSVYVSKKDIPKGTDISNEEYWYLLIEKLKKGIDYFTEEDRKAIIDEVTKLAESDFNKYYDEKKKELDKVASDNTTAFLKTVKDSTTDFNSNVDTQIKAFDSHYDEKIKSFDENSDKQTKAYDTNANKKLNDYNENHKTKMQELDDEATKKITEYDEHSEELRNMTVSTDNKVERLKNEVLDTGTESDTFIHIEDSCMAKLKELEIEGVCKQETTTGKNIVDFNVDHTVKTSGVEFSYVFRDGKLLYIKLNGTSTSDIYHVVKSDITLQAGTYKSYNGLSGIKNGAQMYINIEGNWSSTDKYNFILNKETKVSVNIYVAQNSTLSNQCYYPMITLGNNSDDSYEPYTGGNPSPNPDYPQEIKTITDSLKITSCGKNMIHNISKYLPSSIAKTETIYDDDIGSIALKGVPNGTWDAKSNSGNIFNLQPNIEYTLYLKAVGVFPKGLFTINLYDDSSSLAFKSIRVGISQPVIFLLDDNHKIKATRLVIEGIDSTANYDCVLYPMLVRGSYTSETIGMFESYVESSIKVKLSKGEFIGKFNDIKDTLKVEYNEEDSKYHFKLAKKLGRKVFSASDDWSRVNSNASVRFSVSGAEYARNGNYETDIPKFKSNYFQPNTFANIYQKDQPGISWWFNDTKKNWVLSFGNNMTLEDFKNFLLEHIVEVYYPLETPYELDLGPIDMPLSYKEITNILADSDLLPTINAKYYRTFEKTIQNMQINEKSLKQEIADLNNNISDITKRLEVLESANVSTAEESEVSNDLQN